MRCLFKCVNSKCIEAIIDLSVLEQLYVFLLAVCREKCFFQHQCLSCISGSSMWSWVGLS